MAEFSALAKERWRRHPMKCLIGLPLKRVFRLWLPVAEWELPMRTPLLHLPKLRSLFGVWEAGLYLLALFGAVAMLRRPYRADQFPLAAVIGSTIVARSLLFSFAIPETTNGRYRVEVMPLVCVFAVYGIVWTGKRNALKADAESLSRKGDSSSPKPTDSGQVLQETPAVS